MAAAGAMNIEIAKCLPICQEACTRNCPLEVRIRFGRKCRIRRISRSNPAPPPRTVDAIAHRRSLPVARTSAADDEDDKLDQLN